MGAVRSRLCPHPSTRGPGSSCYCLACDHAQRGGRGQASLAPDPLGYPLGQTVSWSACASLFQKPVLPGTGCHLRTENAKGQNLALQQMIAFQSCLRQQIVLLGLWPELGLAFPWGTPGNPTRGSPVHICVCGSFSGCWRACVCTLDLVFI